MIETAGGAVGFIEPLDTLAEQFAGPDAPHQAKVMDLQDQYGFGGWRRILGDGNCFYRAFGFAHVESILRKKPKSLQRKFLDPIRVSASQEAEGLLELGKSLCRLEPLAALEQWYREMLTNKQLDAQLVRAMRLISAEFLVNNQDIEIDEGLPLREIVRTSHGTDVNKFKKELLRDGVEAESVALMLAPMALEVKLEIIQLHRNSNEIQRNCVPDIDDMRVGASLLFRPGHYDIIYSHNHASELLQLQEQLELQVECSRSGAGATAHLDYHDPYGHHDHHHHQSSSSHHHHHQEPLEAALDSFNRTLRERVQSADRAIDRERARLADQQRLMEQTRQDIQRLRQGNESLREEVERKQAQVHREQEEVTRLREGGFLAMCYAPAATSRDEVRSLTEAS